MIGERCGLLRRPSGLQAEVHVFGYSIPDLLSGGAAFLAVVQRNLVRYPPDLPFPDACRQSAGKNMRVQVDGENRGDPVKSCEIK